MDDPSTERSVRAVRLGFDNYAASCHVSYSLLLRIGRDEYESYQVEERQIVDNSQNVPDKGSREIQML
jgi:hypothetical protein